MTEDPTLAGHRLPAQQQRQHSTSVTQTPRAHLILVYLNSYLQIDKHSYKTKYPTRSKWNAVFSTLYKTTGTSSLNRSRSKKSNSYRLASNCSPCLSGNVNMDSSPNLCYVNELLGGIYMHLFLGTFTNEKFMINVYYI